MFGCGISRNTVGGITTWRNNRANTFSVCTKSGSARVKCQRPPRSRSGKNFFQRGAVSGEIGGGIIQWHGALVQKGFGLPIIEAQHRAHLSLGKASRAITFNGRTLQNVTANRIRGISPLAGNLVGHFNGDLHGVVNLAQARRDWQSSSGLRPSARQLDLAGLTH